MDKLCGRGLTYLSWGLGGVGIIMFILRTISAGPMEIPQLVGGIVLFAMGTAVYLVCQLRE